MALSNPSNRPPTATAALHAAAGAAPLDPPAPANLRFGPLDDPDARFELQPAERQLLVDGHAVPLRKRALDLLSDLLAHAGHLRTREQLLDQVWPGLVVEENNLSVQINGLRKLLGRELLATVPGQGYRLLVRLAPHPGQPPTLHPLPSAIHPTARRSPLPEPAALIGRDDELAALASLVAQHRLVSVVGSGGLGKTRLALALLHSQRPAYTHGVCFVDLAPVTQAADLPDTVAAALGLPQARGGDALAALARPLAVLQILVVLDNAEHLIGPVAQLAATLLAAAPGLRLLVTSQAPLKTSGEWLYRLGGLAVPPAGCSVEQALQHGAVALFMARAHALDRRFTLTEARLPAVLGLCRQLDGSALAIELAAARLPLLGLDGLVASLSQPLQLLTQGLRDAPARQQTMRAALAWSHALLGPAEQRVFRRLAVFAGSASLSAVQQVLADDGPPGADTLDGWAVLDALGGLVDRSLVSLVLHEAGADDSPDTPPPGQREPRYRLLEAPLALAREQLQASGEAPALQRRHAAAVQALLQRTLDEALAGRLGVTASEALLRPDIANAQAALRWALQHDHAAALAIAAALSRALDPHRHADRVALWQAAEPVLDAALEALAAGLPPAEADDAPAEPGAGAPGATSATSARGARGARGAPGAPGARGAPAAPGAPGARSARSARSAPGASGHPPHDPDPHPPTTIASPVTVAEAALQCAEVWQNTRTQHAATRAEQARRLALQAGDAQLAYRALRVIAFTAYRLADTSRAPALARARQALEQPGWPAAVRVAGAATEAWLCMLAGDHDGAIRWREIQAALLQASGAPDASALLNIASAQMAAGRYEASIALSRALAQRLSGERDQKTRCFVLSNLSGCLLTLQRADEAQAVLRESWPLARQVGLQPEWADDAALVAALQKRPRAALQLAGYADAAFGARGQPREAIDQLRFERAVALAREALAGDAPGLAAPASADAAGDAAAALLARGARLPEADLPGLAFAAADA